MPNVPGTKIWLRNKELDTVCRVIEKTPPMGRLMIAYEFALQNVKRQKQALSNTIRVSKFVIWYWFNMGHLGRPIPYDRFNEIMEAGQ